MRVLSTLAGLVCLASLAAGCSSGAGPQDRHLTADFPSARSFYPQSKVKIMGADVGTVDKIENLGDRIRVRFHVRGDVPLARGLNASIMPLDLVGERHLVLSPAWRPGMGKETGDMIPMSRTHIPVETDEALKAYTNLAEALDPAKVRGALGKAADSVRGNGDEFNRALEQGARLTTNVAAQDKELLAVAKDLDRLAGVVRGREQVLGVMIRDFGTATKVLAAEREDLKRLVKGLHTLTDEGDALIDKYEGQLPYDIAVLTRVALVLDNQSGRIRQLLDGLPGINEAYTGAYDEQTRSLYIRFATDAFLRTWLKDLLSSDDVPCLLPPPNSDCPWQGRGGLS